MADAFCFSTKSKYPVFLIFTPHEMSFDILTFRPRVLGPRSASFNSHACVEKKGRGGSKKDSRYMVNLEGKEVLGWGGNRK